MRNLPWNCLDYWYDNKTNISKQTLILSMILASIKFIYSSKHFDGQLLWLKISAGLVCISVFASLYQWTSYRDGSANSEIGYITDCLYSFWDRQKAEFCVLKLCAFFKPAIISFAQKRSFPKSNEQS